MDSFKHKCWMIVVPTRLGIYKICAMMLLILLCLPAVLTAMSRKGPVHISHPVVGDVTGEVLVQGRGQSTWEPVERGTLLFSGDVVRSGTGGSAGIKFASGKIELYEDTEIQIPSTGPEQRKKDIRDVVIRNGRVLLDVSMADNKGYFIFRTDNIQGQASRSMVTVDHTGKGTAVDVYQGEAQVLQAGEYGKKTSNLVPGSSFRIGRGETVGRVARFDPPGAVRNKRNKIRPDQDKVSGLPLNDGMATKSSVTDIGAAGVENADPLPASTERRDD